MPFQHTPETLALSEARKAKKLSKKLIQSNEPRLLQEITVFRPWLTLHTETNRCLPIKVLTWNLLAQCLVRRQLFPASDCLKAGQREPLLHREILSHNADILCLQEVDRLEQLLPVLQKAGYTHHFRSGPGKLHGCIIAYKAQRFSLVAEKVVYYDEERVRTDGSELGQRGVSFNTRNIGIIVALKANNNQNDSLDIPTKGPGRDFGSPYKYCCRCNLTRQAALLIREVSRFKVGHAVEEWPCIVAGDFNFPPDDPVYSLLSGDELLAEQQAKLSASYVVHSTVDHDVLLNTGKQLLDDQEGGDADDPDVVIVNARNAIPADGLLSIPELVTLFSSQPRVRSSYDVGLADYLSRNFSITTYGDRVQIPPGRHGSHEPEYTSYAHYWKTVLDYVFVLDPPGRYCQVTGILSPFQAVDLEPGLPQRRVSGSDHVSLVAELVWPQIHHINDP
ncbi:hypothetical protein K443DRAFT_129486 [Laccaria amethystina LaAM-08-1]|uniref:Endonuclease/exonuclease/phosphatase domain-containing protein n=1 Tax=Laccaria amethystina LaAM-08-1 TaxID=1095629 RepID=A0A0C9Y9K5_9AGAR|nr:hypothetical protein K443DRAFT_129486 [Laccaria amethystina LaAM-08-1]